MRIGSQILGGCCPGLGPRGAGPAQLALGWAAFADAVGRCAFAFVGVL